MVLHYIPNSVVLNISMLCHLVSALGETCICVLKHTAPNLSFWPPAIWMIFPFFCLPSWQLEGTREQGMSCLPLQRAPAMTPIQQLHHHGHTLDTICTVKGHNEIITLSFQCEELREFKAGLMGRAPSKGPAANRAAGPLLPHQKFIVSHISPNDHNNKPVFFFQTLILVTWKRVLSFITGITAHDLWKWH